MPSYTFGLGCSGRGPVTLAGSALFFYSLPLFILPVLSSLRHCGQRLVLSGSLQEPALCALSTSGERRSCCFRAGKSHLGTSRQGPPVAARSAASRPLCPLSCRRLPLWINVCTMRLTT